MERRLALLTTLAFLAVPAAAAQAAPVKIGPKPTSVSGSTATIEVANPTRRALRGTATVMAGAKTAATQAVKLPKVSVTDVKLRFAAKGVEALRAANGRATVKLSLRRAGAKKKMTARRTLTIRLAAGGAQPPAPGGTGGGQTPAPSGGSGTPDGGTTTPQPTPSNKWVGRMGTEGAYDDLEFTLIDGQLQITKTPLVPTYCFESGGAYRTALSFEPFVVAGPWTIGTDGSVQQSGIASNQLVSSGSRGITYTLKESAQSAGKVTGKLGMSYFDSKLDPFTYKIWFVNCSGSQSFEAVPA